MTEPSASNTEIKLSWEIRKLQAEVEALKRPFKNPSVIAALTTATFVAIVSCMGLVLQWLRSDRDYTLAQIRAERLKLDAEKLQAGFGRLQADSNRLQAESKRLQAERVALEAEVVTRRRELQLVQNEIAKTKAALKAAPISEAERDVLIEDLSAAEDSLRLAAAQYSTVYYVVDTFGNLARQGVIHRGAGLRRDWVLNPSSFNDRSFLTASRLSLAEIVVPASPADVSVLTIHGKGSWRLSRLSNDATRFEITDRDKFWSTGTHLVLAIRK